MADESPPSPASAEFWDAVYAQGGTSGTGSYGRLAHFKADVVNRLVDELDVDSVIEFGCGDGHQLSLMRYPRYLGLDISPTAIEKCRQMFADDATRRFRAYRSGDELTERADLAISLDVVYHLLEDAVFERYMQDLFAAAARFVLVYSSDHEEGSEWPEVRHRRFTAWVDEFAPGWRLRERIANRYPYVPGDVDSSWSDFYLFEKRPRRRRFPFKI